MTTSTHNDGFNLYFAQIKSKVDGEELPTPVILINDAKTKESSRHSCLRGFIEGIKYKTFEYKGDVIPQYQIAFVNPTTKDRVLFDVAFSVLGRTLMNALLGVTDFSKEEFEISVFKNKAGYPAVGFQTDSNRCEWKFKREELPEVPKVTLNGKENSDFTALNEFYTKHMDAFIKEVKFFQTPTATEQVAEEIFGSEVPSSLPQGDEIPVPPFDPMGAQG